MKLDTYQIDAIKKLRSGSILCGETGSGKSLTGLAYYYITNHGNPDFLIGEGKLEMDKKPEDLIIITTAKKRDDREWEKELNIFSMSSNPEFNRFSNKIVVDSWNNIKKYKDVKESFFIFDEQRLVGTGVWVKSFFSIAKNNRWILLSATPGDTWMDYMPVFIANGFYRNITDFKRRHVVYNPRNSKFPQIDHYVDTHILQKYRNRILVDMEYKRPTVQHHQDVICEYDRHLYKQTMKDRWDPYDNCPIENISKLCYLLQKISNSDESRQQALLEILKSKTRVIIFYNYDYELDILRNLPYRMKEGEPVIAEWNGHKHEKVPDSLCWIYLVQYAAGCEGWNCITSDSIVFYSQNYSYKVMQQASGRIDRRNTKFVDLYYYHFKSKSSIDLAISKAIATKKRFNENRFINSC